MVWLLQSSNDIIFQIIPYRLYQYIKFNLEEQTHLLIIIW